MMPEEPTEDTPTLSTDVPTLSTVLLLVMAAGVLWWLGVFSP